MNYSAQRPATPLSVLTRARLYSAKESATSATGRVKHLALWRLRVQIGHSEVLPKMLQVLPVSPHLSKPQNGVEIFQKVNEIFQNGGAVFQKVGAIF